MKSTIMNKIINFHLVNDIDWFDRMICFLKSRYEMIDIDTLFQYYSGNINLNNTCHITVDDGDKTFYDIIFPVLRKHNVPASLFVSPKICEEKLNYWFQEIEGYDENKFRNVIADLSGVTFNSVARYSIPSVLKTMQVSQLHEIISRYQKLTNTPPKVFQNMTVSDLKEVDRSGLVSIGAHTLNHPILANESAENSKHEIAVSINDLSAILGHEVNYFAYPNGIPMLDFTEREEEYLKDCKVRLAFTTEAKNITLNDSHMRIPRIGVSNNENPLFLKIKLLFGSSWDKLKRLKTTGEFSERKRLRQLITTKTDKTINQLV